jgi:hypothetical protein
MSDMKVKEWTLKRIGNNTYLIEGPEHIYGGIEVSGGDKGKVYIEDDDGDTVACSSNTAALLHKALGELLYGERETTQ